MIPADVHCCVGVFQSFGDLFMTSHVCSAFALTCLNVSLYVFTAPVVTPTLTVVSNWSSSDSCNVTLKCTGLNVSLISRCNGTFCSQEGGDRFLSIAFNRTTVSCNHSNPVSWRQTTMELEPLCPWYISKSGNL